MKKILIIGATSVIAQSVARVWAKQAAQIHLIARNSEKLASVSADLSIRGAENLSSAILDVDDYAGHEAAIDEAISKLGAIDIVLIAHGTLCDQDICETDFNAVNKAFTTNTLSTLSLLTHLANRMEAQGKGTIAVITSVAGDRGRPSNYVYGAAKASVSTFCEGLRARLFKSAVHVIDLRPGFVATPMTEGLALPQLLVSQPEKVAEIMVRRIEARKNVAYVPGYWFLIMTIIRSIPRFVFKRLSL